MSLTPLRIVTAALVVALLVLLVVAALTHGFGETGFRVAILLVAAAAVTSLRLALRARITRADVPRYEPPHEPRDTDEDDDWPGPRGW